MVYNIRDEAYWHDDYPWYIAGYFWGGLQRRAPDELHLHRLVRLGRPHRRRRRAPVPLRRCRRPRVRAPHPQRRRRQRGLRSSTRAWPDLAEQFIYGTAPSSAGTSATHLFYHRDSLTDWDGELYDYGNTDAVAGLPVGARRWRRPVRPRSADRVTPGYEPFDETADKFVDPGDAFTWNLIHDQANGLAGRGEPGRRHGQRREAAPRLDARQPARRQGLRAEVELPQPRPGRRRLRVHYTIQDGIKFYNAEVGGNMPPTRKNVWRNAVDRAVGRLLPQLLRQRARPADDLHRCRRRTASRRSPAPTSGTRLSATCSTSACARQVDGVARRQHASRSRPGTTSRTSGTTATSRARPTAPTWVKLEQVSALPDRDGQPQRLERLGRPRRPDRQLRPAGRTAEYSFGDLSGTVWIRFRYMTDEAANGVGWYVDDVQGRLLRRRRHRRRAGPTTAGTWTNGLQNNDWTADACVPYAKARQAQYSVVSIVGLTARASPAAVPRDPVHQAVPHHRRHVQPAGRRVQLDRPSDHQQAQVSAAVLRPA